MNCLESCETETPAPRRTNCRKHGQDPNHGKKTKSQPLEKISENRKDNWNFVLALQTESGLWRFAYSLPSSWVDKRCNLYLGVLLIDRSLTRSSSRRNALASRATRKVPPQRGCGLLRKAQFFNFLSIWFQVDVSSLGLSAFGTTLVQTIKDNGWLNALKSEFQSASFKSLCKFLEGEFSSQQSTFSSIFECSFKSIHPRTRSFLGLIIRLSIRSR